MPGAVFIFHFIFINRQVGVCSSKYDYCREGTIEIRPNDIHQNQNLFIYVFHYFFYAFLVLIAIYVPPQ